MIKNRLFSASLIGMLLLALVGSAKAGELTVYDGTTESYYGPVFTFYFDEFAR